MKITKPFEGYQYIGGDEEVPCWFFEGVEIPDIDFDKLPWESSQNNVLQEENIYSLRYNARRNTLGPLELELERIINSVINEIKENHVTPGLKNMYPWNTWKNNYWFDIKKELKGFEMGQHLDNRCTKWTFIMNLADHNESTVFLKDGFLPPYNLEAPIMAPTKKGSGSFYFNHHSLLHKIGPLTTDVRYILFQQNRIDLL